MRVGGPADRLVTAGSTDELVEAIREGDAAGQPLIILGGGSNVVIADAGWRGTVVRVATRGIQVESADACSGATVRVAAGEPWDEFVALAVSQGWSGVEALSGIPGCVGATPIQNVGAYGQEIAQTLAQVRVWDRSAGGVRTLAAADCEFAYRDSRFKRAAGRYVVLDVVLQLPLCSLGAPVGYPDLAAQLGVAVGERVPLAAARAAVLQQRRRRGMVLDEADHDTWSCGSFFTNPVLTGGEFAGLTARVGGRLGPGHPPPAWPQPGGAVKTSAAWLIERAGFGKGFGLPGPAALSTKHTLAVTNRGTASAADVLALARRVRDGVQATFGVRLHPEPVLVGVSL
ncbi:MAG: UDP-N-acetylmuramate dehydrogenase [Dermatophilaceae bacterium]